MSGLGVEEEEGLGRATSSYGYYAYHRRSRSASDKNLKGSDQLQKDSNESHGFPPATRSSRASLERDIELLQLRLKQERSMRMLLERAMGRTSSTLSPGHRHFSAQTKELIAEIELLEDEVANREKHVLFLYRSIFEQCTSRPSSSEQSSVATSPAHSKTTESRKKHPSIISSAFCSSKKFPLRSSFQALSSKNVSGKRSSHSKTKSASIFSCERDQHIQKCPSGNEKVVQRAPLVKTLKDHLHQCPSKLSVEMVKCMSAIYCWLQKTIVVNTGKRESVKIPWHDINEEKDRFRKSTIVISWISTDKSNFSHASYAINNYRVMVEQLERVNISQMETNAKIAFWINLYNSLVMHAFLAYGIPQNSIRRLALFHKAAYNIAGHAVSANAIEQTIFSLKTPRMGWWLEAILSTAIRKKTGEEKELISSKFGLKEQQPLVCFALCTGAFSDPMLRVYTGSKVREELETAKREFLQANVIVKKSQKVVLPKSLERYAKEARIPPDDLLRWIMENVDKKLRDSVHNCMERRACKKASSIIHWSPYSSRFQYVISNDLVEKPWYA
ncbi:hypothetical protein DM860_011766 [Cuscuta australis]|uniref:DUF547 domain-containing protein n=1 Tax=Cuscuta australis TaxID=267555 RepID=A0A328DJJ6_9ASTE|nr:hypothetical protein DM860_011766 [Cuscuta australis]